MGRNKYEAQAREARRANWILRSCESKVAFETEEAAYQKGQTSYKCQHCGKWHRSGAFGRFVKQLQRKARR